MGFYFRKSKSFGPLRFNFSKSGVGVSTGVKGARLSMGPKGTYINVGKNGIYYRKKIGSSSTKKSAQSKNPIHSMPSRYENTYSFTDAIQVSTVSGNTSELSNSIIKDVRRANALSVGWFILLVVLFVSVSQWTLFPMLLVRVLFPKFFCAVIKYDLDSGASLEWEKYSEIINMLKSSNKVWIIETAKLNSDIKYHAGASRNVSRGTATVKKIKPNHHTGFKVKTDVFSVVVKSARCSLLFLPSDVIVKKGNKYVAYSYDQLTVYSSTTNFIEYGALPRDAEIIRHTWQYVNKDGSADKRFNRNRQIPVCQYGLVRFAVGQELSIELHTSNKQIAGNVGNAYKLYKAYIDTIGLTQSPRTRTHAEVIAQPAASSPTPSTQLRENANDLSSIAAAGVGIFDDGDEKDLSVDGGKDIYSDLFEVDSTTDDDNSLIDDMSMFLDEES